MFTKRVSRYKSTIAAKIKTFFFSKKISNLLGINKS